MAEIRQAPNTIGKARVDLVPDEFDVLIFQKGAEVVWEMAMPCPCKLDGRGFVPTCMNCGGSGFIFVNPVETRMLLQSLNLMTKYVEWSVERIGTTAITTRSIDVLGEMDKITLSKSTSNMSQVLRPLLYDNRLFAFTNYPVVDLSKAFMFDGANRKLVDIPLSDIEFDGNKMYIKKDYYRDDLVISLRYKHRIQYHVIDITREVRESRIAVVGGRDKIGKFPMSAVGRRCHYVLRPNDYYNPVLDANS